MTLQPFDHPPRSVEVRAPSGPPGLLALQEWVTAAGDAEALVRRLVSTPFVPDAYKPRITPNATREQREEAVEQAVANGTAAVLQGITHGWDPLTSLQNIYIVHGRPGMYAKMMVALVLSHGHEVWVEDESDTRVVVCGRRKGSQTVERVAVTMDQAKRAGWTSNPAYGKTPRDMLWSRASSRVCDRIAADVVKGLASVEEIEDDHAAVTPVAARQVQRRSRAVAAAPAAPALPEARGETVGNPAASTVTVPPSGPPLPGEDTPAPEEPVPSTTTQHREIGRLLADLGIVGEGSRSARAARVSGIVGRPVDSATHLTTVEADQVISALAADVELDRRIAETRQQQPADDVQVEDPPAGVDPESGEVLVDWPPENGADQ